jgi:hypothetical protein
MLKGRVRRQRWRRTRQISLSLSLYKASETVRKDINLMLHFLEIAAVPKEILTKYKLINENLSFNT